MDVKNLIESDQLEFKRELGKSEKLAVELIAFANSRGGQLVIGYDEKSSQVIGVQPRQETEEYISNIVSDLCEPRLDYSVSYQTIDGKPLLVISVPQQFGGRPYHLKGRSISEGSYIRIGSTSRRADQAALARLIRQGKNRSFDSEQVSESISLDNEKIQDYLQQRHSRLGAPIVKVTPSLLEDLNLTRNGSVTVAGVLLFASDPQGLPELSTAYIQAARFKGEIKGLFLDQMTISGSLPQQVDEATQFMLRNVAVRGEVHGTRRVDQFQYDPEILREMVVNAVIHRDYSRNGATIQLAVFDDRIEITSPGGLPGGVTVQSAYDRQFNRNPIIAKRMFEIGYFDSWGQGLDKIRNWAQARGFRLPRLVDDPDQFTLIVYSESDEDHQSRSSRPFEQRVLALAEEHGSIANRDLQKVLKLSKTQAQVVLKKLVEAGRLEARGRGRATRYVSVELFDSGE